MKFRNEYWFLSNMFPAEMKVNGLTFTCAEACFQSFKTEDKELRKKFQNLNGFEAKKLGKKIKLRSNWNEIRLEVMLKVVAVKFHQHPELQELLKNVTEDIVEDNTWNDTFWGKCNGIGENNLGLILTFIRHTIFANELKCLNCKYCKPDSFQQAMVCTKTDDYKLPAPNCHRK